MISFILIVCAWILLGVAGILRCKEKTHYDMIVFMFGTPFIPLIAQFFGII